jgi:hypothetical protein
MPAFYWLACVVLRIGVPRVGCYRVILRPAVSGLGGQAVSLVRNEDVIFGTLTVSESFPGGTALERQSRLTQWLSAYTLQMRHCPI